MITLTALPFSPWSEKARWALDHHQIPYKYDTFVPLLGELKLRLRMRKLAGRVTVPVLFDGDTFFTDSFEIARQADRLGGGATLFPAGKLAEISEWNQHSETALSAGRARTMLALAGEPGLALAFLPPSVPAALKPLLLPLAQKGVARFINKYRMRDEAERHEAVFQRELERLAQALSGKRYLIGDTLSYADIAMALIVQGVSPVDVRYMARLPSYRPSATPTELQSRYAALISWRDELYAKHRHPSPARPSAPSQ